MPADVVGNDAGALIALRPTSASRFGVTSLNFGTDTAKAGRCLAPVPFFRKRLFGRPAR
jgi:hypothetical protein